MIDDVLTMIWLIMIIHDDGSFRAEQISFFLSGLLLLFSQRAFLLWLSLLWSLISGQYIIDQISTIKDHSSTRLIRSIGDELGDDFGALLVLLAHMSAIFLYFSYWYQFRNCNKRNYHSNTLNWLEQSLVLTPIRDHFSIARSANKRSLEIMVVRRVRSDQPVRSRMKNVPLHSFIHFCIHNNSDRVHLASIQAPRQR